MEEKACEAKRALLLKIGKDFRDFTEEDWDILFAHTDNCLICYRNNLEADKFLNRHLKSAIRDYFQPLAQILKFNPQARGKQKRPK